MEQKSSAKGLSIASLICGILSIVTFVIILASAVNLGYSTIYGGYSAAASLGLGMILMYVLGFIVGIMAIIFGAIGMAKSKSVGNSKALSIVGLILGILGVIALAAIIISTCACATCYASSLSRYY